MSRGHGGLIGLLILLSVLSWSLVFPFPRCVTGPGGGGVVNGVGWGSGGGDDGLRGGAGAGLHEGHEGAEVEGVHEPGPFEANFVQAA